MTKQVSLDHSINDIIPTVVFFHNNQPKFQQKDINQYSDLKELEDIIKNVGPSKRQEKLKISKEDVDKIIKIEVFTANDRSISSDSVPYYNKLSGIMKQNAEASSDNMIIKATREH